jgi:hypothetical protein
MAYQAFKLKDGREEVRCAPGDIVHMTPHSDGTWTVDEDQECRVFRNRGAALDCAREIGQDPDLPRGTQI